MTTVLNKISEWAGDLPYWEQAALDQIMWCLPIRGRV